MTARKHKILVADDVREIRDMLRLFLEPRFDVVLARNGEEAWELFNAEVPDLVLSDCVMPRVDGLELLGRIRTGLVNPATPVIMITAATTGSDLADGLWAKAAGSDGFLSKPFSYQQVIEKIEKYLGGARETPAPAE